MRLFATDSDSPLPCTSPKYWNDSEIGAVITPFGKSANFFASGKGNNSEYRDEKRENLDAAGARKDINPFLIDEDSGLGMEADMVNINLV